MSVSGLHLLESGNANALDDKSTWIVYSMILTMFTIFWISIPYLPLSLTFTTASVIHSVVHYYLFHYVKGTPYVSFDCGETQHLTYWDQINNGVMYTATRKFLLMPGVVMFIIGNHISNFNAAAFALNSLAFLLITIPKLHIFYNSV